MQDYPLRDTRQTLPGEGILGPAPLVGYSFRFGLPDRLENSADIMHVNCRKRSEILLVFSLKTKPASPACLVSVGSLIA